MTGRRGDNNPIKVLLRLVLYSYLSLAKQNRIVLILPDASDLAQKAGGIYHNLEEMSSFEATHRTHVTSVI